jgi:hypothetical protein
LPWLTLAFCIIALFFLGRWDYEKLGGEPTQFFLGAIVDSLVIKLLKRLFSWTSPFAHRHWYI